MHRLIPALAIAAAVFSTTALAQDKNNEKFITTAIEGNYAEVDMGRLAEKNSQSQDVKTFGQMLVTDHGAANQKAKQAATTAGVKSPPSGPNAKQKSDHDSMAKLQGAAFDKMFAEHMVADHKKDISEYEQGAKTKDAIGQYAESSLPTLRKHLEEAEKLQKSHSAQR
jgi:putative membrane protein